MTAKLHAVPVVTTFAAQAVIAIENARLLTELTPLDPGPVFEAFAGFLTRRAISLPDTPAQRIELADYPPRQTHLKRVGGRPPLAAVEGAIDLASLERRRLALPPAVRRTGCCAASGSSISRMCAPTRRAPKISARSRSASRCAKGCNRPPARFAPG